jgi:hypothetical protein
MQREIMLFLEQHAYNKVAAKYSYLHATVQEDIVDPLSWDTLDF